MRGCGCFKGLVGKGVRDGMLGPDSKDESAQWEWRRGQAWARVRGRGPAGAESALWGRRRRRRGAVPPASEGKRPRPGPTLEPPLAVASRSLLEPPRRLNLGAGSGPARRRAQDRGRMPEDQAGTAMVREQGLPEPQSPATPAPAGLPCPRSGAPLRALSLPYLLVTAPSVGRSSSPVLPVTCRADIPLSSFLSGDTRFCVFVFNHPQ